MLIKPDLNQDAKVCVNAVTICVYLCLFSLWTALTCDPREPLLWSQSERGSICGETEIDACSNRSPAHPACVLQLAKRP